ncbi:MAG TPA: GntR family transcriptional regulator [Pseudogracilibacillus sp.]|nr:GntR family transcriptional regulator [Pseudogracilibacillus sp.]
MTNLLIYISEVTIVKLDPTSTKPIYLQIAEWLENEILQGHFQEDDKVHSQYTLAEMFQINPATAAKGLTALGEAGILYDRRGLGKFVQAGAREKLKEKRKKVVMETLIEQLIKEANYLNIDKKEVLNMIESIYRQEGEQ